MDLQDLKNALTIRVQTFSEKAIGIQDLASNGIRPLVLKQLRPRQDEELRQDEAEKNVVLEQLDIKSKVDIPSLKTLQAISALEGRPQHWNDYQCRNAISCVEWIQTSAAYPHLVTVDYQVTSVEDLRPIVSPRVLRLFVHAVEEEEWILWPTEASVHQILNGLVAEHTVNISTLLKKSSSNITFKVVTPLDGQDTRHYTPLPDAQLRVNMGNGTLPIAWFEMDPGAKGADRRKMLLALHSEARSFRLVPQRTESVLLVGVYMNFDRSLRMSSEITIFRIPPSSDDGPGATDFINVMSKVLRHIGNCFEKDSATFLTLHTGIADVKEVIRAETSGALTQTDKSSKKRYGDLEDEGNNGTDDAKRPSGGGLKRRRPDSDGDARENGRLRCQLWMPPSPSSASAPASELGEEDETIYYLRSNSLDSELQEMISCLVRPKYRGILDLRHFDDVEPFALAKFASSKEVDHTVSLQTVPGTVRVLSYHPVNRKDLNLLITHYAGPGLHWYCDTYKHLSSKVALPVQVAHDLVATVQAVHDAGIVHLDIKSANICVPDRDLSGSKAVLIDFGSSRRLPGLPVCYPFGTVGWLAPEVERQEEAVDLVLVDVWAVGKVLLYMCDCLPKEADGFLLLTEVGKDMSAPEPTQRMSLATAAERLQASAAVHPQQWGHRHAQSTMYPNALEVGGKKQNADFYHYSQPINFETEIKASRQLFPPDHPASRAPDLEALLGALVVANEWGVEEIASDIVEQAADKFTSPFDKLVMGKRHDVLPWFRSGLEELVTSDEEISIEDANEIGLIVTIRIYHARARCTRRFRTSGKEGAIPVSLVLEVVEEMLRDMAVDGSLWKADLTDAGGEGPGGSSDISLESGSDTAADEIFDSIRESSSPEAGLVSASQYFPSSQNPDKNFIRALVGGVLASDARHGKRLLEMAPKLCRKKDKTCGPDIRCRKCCLHYLRMYQPLPENWRAKTTLGQAFLDHICEIGSGNGMTVAIVLKDVDSCKKAQCGPRRRRLKAKDKKCKIWHTTLTMSSVRMVRKHFSAKLIEAKALQLDRDQEDDGTEVTWEDQQRINTFSKLNSRLRNINEKLEQLKQEKEALDDLSTELELADEDELVLYKIGEAFLHMTHPKALKRLEKDQSGISSRVSTLSDQAEECEKEMKNLKVALYAKFGNAINLDD
ncbi:hypothetical protein V5O48_000152 [Marasmius crinis-equi]|uniref:Protein kinase domain-containing protein n=1 Tax=Marasmius crinis-equi TaxID=585013 RepID=A0ABR3G255_9AGAR